MHNFLRTGAQIIGLVIVAGLVVFVVFLLSNNPVLSAPIPTPTNTPAPILKNTPTLTPTNIPLSTPVLQGTLRTVDEDPSNVKFKLFSGEKVMMKYSLNNLNSRYTDSSQLGLEAIKTKFEAITLFEFDPELDAYSKFVELQSGQDKPQKIAFIFDPPIIHAQSLWMIADSAESFEEFNKLQIGEVNLQCDGIISREGLYLGKNIADWRQDTGFISYYKDRKTLYQSSGKGEYDPLSSTFLSIIEFPIDEFGSNCSDEISSVNIVSTHRIVKIDVAAIFIIHE